MFDRQDKRFLSEAVVVVKDGAVLFHDPAAADIIPDIENLKLTEIFDQPYPPEGREPVTKEIEVEGRRVQVTAVSQGGHTLLILRRLDNAGEQALSAIEAASGEMRNLLSVMRMALSLIVQQLEVMDNPKLMNYASMMTHSYYGLLRLTNNLSDFSSYLRGSYRLNYVFFDIANLVRELADSIRMLLRGKDIEVRVKGGEKPVLIYADKEKIEKLILNLVSNSVAAIGDGRGTVTLSLAATQDRVVLSVSDDGKGMTEEEIARVWNRFMNRESGEGRGIGLGLTIVQMIARQHGGSALLESQVGVGTTVTVSLPLFAQEDRETSLKTEQVPYESSSISPLLTEFSSVLNYTYYDPRFVD